jgi:hypothetical protein
MESSIRRDVLGEIEMVWGDLSADSISREQADVIPLRWHWSSGSEIRRKSRSCNEETIVCSPAGTAICVFWTGLEVDWCAKLHFAHLRQELHSQNRGE